MLKTFSVSNYKNFDGEVTLDFSKSKNYAFNTHVIRNGLLNKVLIVGKNGTGKTNLGRALFDIVYTLTDRGFEQHQIDAPSFLNGNSKRTYAEFRYVFLNDGSEIEYTYRKTLPRNIVYEQLKVDGRILYERDGVAGVSDYSALSEIGAGSLQVDAIGNGQLAVLRFIKNNTVQHESSPVSYIMNFVEGMLYFRSTQDGNSYIGFTKSGEAIENYIIDNGLVDDFGMFLKKTADVDMDLAAVRTELAGNVLVQRFNTKQLVFGSVASSGTQALMLFYYWRKHFGGVTFLFMDEFDAYYHYELSVNVLKMVSDDVDFQTVFTSHNTALVSNDVLRPDCYMVLESGKLRTFPELTDRELRQGHNLEKMLRNGVFDE